MQLRCYALARLALYTNRPSLFDKHNVNTEPFECVRVHVCVIYQKGPSKPAHQSTNEAWSSCWIRPVNYSTLLKLQPTFMCVIFTAVKHCSLPLLWVISEQLLKPGGKITTLKPLQVYFKHAQGFFTTPQWKLINYSNECIVIIGWESWMRFYCVDTLWSHI